MLLLASTSDKIRLITSASGTVDVHASFVDLSGTTVTPGRKNTAISTGTTTDVVAAPASSTYRTVKTLTVRNRHASSSNDVTVIHTDGTDAMELLKVTLAAGEALHYHEAAGFWVADPQGRAKVANVNSAPAVNAWNIVVLASDVTNNNASANTIADVTGLSFSVTSGQTYMFRFMILYTAAATATGSRWSINGPASPTLLNYRSNYSLTSTTETLNSGQTAYDVPSGANATSVATAGNLAIIEGIITPSASGTVIARFASEVSSSAIVAKAGSILEWIRTV